MLTPSAAYRAPILRLLPRRSFAASIAPLRRILGIR
jgi:hypothetical protein